MDWVGSVVDELSKDRYWITEPRRDLLQRIAGYSRPFTAEQVYADVRGAGRSTNIPATRVMTW